MRKVGPQMGVKASGGVRTLRMRRHDQSGRDSHQRVGRGEDHSGSERPELKGKRRFFIRKILITVPQV
ncbi:MAG: hypothetical protein U0X92_00765 [Anaerolineales bacterium]